MGVFQAESRSLYWQIILKGIVILVAVYVDCLKNEKNKVPYCLRP